VHLENGMVARRFQDLEAWQLANEVKREVFALTESGPAARDFEFRDQIRGSAASAPRNISEGFGRFRPKEFARGCEVANGELSETENCLEDGKDRKYFTTADADRVIALTIRARKVNTRLLLYLRTCPEPKPSRRPKGERRTTNEERGT
jgi:four helix bundle protein